MSALVNNSNYGSIGRMFARQSAPVAYGAQKGARSAQADVVEGQVDMVSLSPLAPRPLSASFLEDALDTAKTLDEGGRLSADRMTKLREDRVFTAMAALAAVGEDDADAVLPRNWPAGLPAPTRDEMEAARRRLAQRLRNVDQAADPEQLQQSRLDLMRKVGKKDFSAYDVDVALAGAAPEA